MSFSFPGSFRRIDLEWDAVPGGDIVGYKVYPDTGGPFTITLDTDGTPAGTVIPDPLVDIGRGEEQMTMYWIDVGGGATPYASTINMGLSSVKLDSKYDGVDTNHDGKYEENEHFCGYSHLAYLPIGSDAFASITGALGAHTLRSTQALNSPTVQSGLKDILPNHAGLWETLLARASVQVTVE